MGKDDEIKKNKNNEKLRALYLKAAGTGLYLQFPEEPWPEYLYQDISARYGIPIAELRAQCRRGHNTSENLGHLTQRVKS